MLSTGNWTDQHWCPGWQSKWIWFGDMEGFGSPAVCFIQQRFRGDKSVLLCGASEWRSRAFERSQGSRFRNSLTDMKTECAAHETLPTLWHWFWTRSHITPLVNLNIITSIKQLFSNYPKNLTDQIISFKYHFSKIPFHIYRFKYTSL